MTRIAIVEGHPDPAGTRLGNALASAYAEGALQGGHEVERVVVAHLDFPILRSALDWNTAAPPEVIVNCQRTLAAADHLAIFYPLWLGDMPALLKAFLEQTFRPTFSTTTATGATFPKILKGKSARIVVTMGMPGFFYRWYYGAHSLKNLERNILKFAGASRVRSTHFGMVEGVTDAHRKKWIDKVRSLGARAS
jgi:putative NADPH-quinone reductase